MKYTHIIRKYILVLSCLFFLFDLYAQTNFGLDNRLYNGKFYNYYPPKAVKGHQFLSSPDFTKGVVWLGENEYNDLSLNLDILNQEVLLAFETSDGAKRVIYLSLAYLDSFVVENKKFVVNQIDTLTQLIEQKIQYANLVFYIHYSKKLELQTSLNGINYYFSNIFKKVTFIKGGKRIVIGSNRAFLKLFEKDKAQHIKHYLRKNKLRIRKMNDIELLNLLEFVNNDTYE